MMDYQLTLPTLLRRAESYNGGKEIVTRLPDKSFHRITYAESCRRARALAVGLQKLGLDRGDRVATLCWNHYQHHEAYLGIPCGGFVLHTLNLRLHPNDLAYIATHAQDKVVIVDRSLMPLLEQFLDRTPIEHVLVVEDSYEDLLASANPDKWDISNLKGMLVGGSAAPRSMIAGFKERHGMNVVHGWGMTETSPVASTSQLPGELAEADADTQFDYIAMRGRPLPLVELRNRDVEGNVLPWDGESMGELEVRGPWVAAGYYDTPEQAERWTGDGWFKTGDICSIHPRGFIQIKDRSKDVIKSGGEWISSVELENALMAHRSG